MKKWTFEEFVRAGGRASAKKRLAGKTKEEISEFMKHVRAGKGVKKELSETELSEVEPTVQVEERESLQVEQRYPEGIE